MSSTLLMDVVRRFVPRGARHVVRNPVASLRWLKDAAADRIGMTATCRMNDAWTVRCTRSSIDAFRPFPLIPDIAAELDAFVRHLHPEVVLFDIGAHYGLFTLAALHYGGSKARVVAVDPSHEACRVLRANIALARDPSRADVYEAAIGAQDGELSMLTTGAGGAHFLLAATQARPDTIVVPQYTLATLAKRSGLVPTHLKIDVEGHEGQVLAGSLDWLRDNRPIIHLELHNDIIRSSGGNPKDVLALLNSLSYVTRDHHDCGIDWTAELAKPITRFIAVPAEAQASTRSS